MGEGLRDIVAKIREVDNLVGHIATASQEQSQGIAQINTAVSQIDKITQSSASSAANTSEIAGKLDGLAGQLKGAVEDLDRILGKPPVADGGGNSPTEESRVTAAVEPAFGRSLSPKAEAATKSF